MKLIRYVGVPVFAAVVLLTGCSSAPKGKIRIGHFTVVSTRNIEFNKIDAAKMKFKARGVEGKFLVEKKFFPEYATNGINQAVENAINKAAGDLMINCVIYRITEDDQEGYLVEGDVVQTMQEAY